MAQATVKTYDSHTQAGTLVGDDGTTEYRVDAETMASSPMFRFLRPGQRVTFDLEDHEGVSHVRNVRIGVA